VFHLKVPEWVRDSPRLPFSSPFSSGTLRRPEFVSQFPVIQPTEARQLIVYITAERVPVPKMLKFVVITRVRAEEIILFIKFEVHALAPT